MEILKGNFNVANPVIPDQTPQSAEQKFEAAAMKRLGGSICYVQKQKVNWGDSRK